MQLPNLNESMWAPKWIFAPNTEGSSFLIEFLPVTKKYYPSDEGLGCTASKLKLPKWF